MADPDIADVVRRAGLVLLTEEARTRIAAHREQPTSATAAAVGSLLESGRHFCDRGAFEPWLATLPISVRVAERHLAIHRLSKRSPELFARVATLSPTKLAMLAPLPTAQLRWVARRRHPGADGSTKSLGLLTTRELAAVLAALPRQPDPPSAAYVALDRRLRALEATVVKHCHRHERHDPDHPDEYCTHAVAAPALTVEQRRQLRLRLRAIARALPIR